jgi:hypothetical protein
LEQLDTPSSDFSSFFFGDQSICISLQRFGELELEERQSDF